MRYALAYLFAALAFGALDAAWLATMTRAFYRPRLGALLAERVELAPAIAFYALYIAGIVYFAVRPALAAGVGKAAFAPALLFGLIAYATYDLTNQATLRAWPFEVTLVDLAWGAFATTVAARFAAWATLALMRRA